MRLYNVVHILVGTPGRVLDLADKGIANLKECNTLIMDEVRSACRRSFVPSPACLSACVHSSLHIALVHEFGVNTYLTFGMHVRVSLGCRHNR